MAELQMFAQSQFLCQTHQILNLVLYWEQKKQTETVKCLTCETFLDLQ